MNNINYYYKYNKYKRKYILLQYGEHNFNDFINKANVYIEK
jgi:hypothetical protein